MELKTPTFNLSDFKNVYEPSEDTFLLLDALENEIDLLIGLKPNFVVEIGSGSGVLITSLAKLLQNNAFFIATDINFEANKATALTANLNNVFVENINMNFLSNFKQNIFDVVLFNPPYVVTESCEIQGTGLSRAWAGGINGREIINQFLMTLPNILTKNGICYMVAIKENKPKNIQGIVNNLGFYCDIIKNRKIPGEHLFVLKIYNK